MRSISIAAAIFILSATGIHSQIQTTFKTVADGQDEINGQPINEPAFSLTGGGGSFTSTLPPITTWLDLATDYTVRIHSDRIEPDKLYKHYRWDEIADEYKLEHVFNSGTPNTPLVKIANFHSPAAVRLFNNFEENAADGMLMFRDPWFVDEHDQQPDILRDFSSPYIPTGKWDETGPAAFLRQETSPGKPYCSARFRGLLAYDRNTAVNPPLSRGDWVLIDLFARDAADAALERTSDTYEYSNGRWQRTAEVDADIKFNNDGADVYGFYKVHMQATHEIPPTQGNSQRKIAALQWAYDSLWYHAVYVSGGKVWYTWTEDHGDTWQPEVLVSDFYNIARRPSIAVKNEHDPKALNGAMLYITYVDESNGTVTLKSRRATDRPDQWYTVDEIELANPQGVNPVVAAISRADSRYCMLVYEGDSTLQ